MRAEGVRNSRLSSRFVGGNTEVNMMMVEVPISRPSPPRPADYVVVPGWPGPRRDFRISVGLREGWTLRAECLTCSEAVRTARAWMKRRVESGQPAPSGMFTRAEVTYACHATTYGTVGSDREPVALFTGEAVHAYLGHLSDAAIEAMLNELATALGAALGQSAFCRVRRPDIDLDAGEHRG